MSAFAYAAPPAAAVFDHDDDENMVGEVSGTVGVVTAVVDDESSDDDSGEDDDSSDDGKVDDGDETNGAEGWNGGERGSPFSRALWRPLRDRQKGVGHAR